MAGVNYFLLVEFDLIFAVDKAYLLKKKKEALEYAVKKNEEKLKKKLTIKDENKKYSLKEMMKVGTQLIMTRTSRLLNLRVASILQVC